MATAISNIFIMNSLFQSHQNNVKIRNWFGRVASVNLMMIKQFIDISSHTCSVNNVLFAWLCCCFGLHCVFFFVRSLFLVPLRARASCIRNWNENLFCMNHRCPLAIFEHHIYGIWFGAVVSAVKDMIHMKVTGRKRNEFKNDFLVFVSKVTDLRKICNKYF